MEIREAGVIVTGAASGLGAATARRLASLGASVGLVDIDGDRVVDLAASIGGLALPGDVASADQMEDAFGVFAAEHGPPRIVVNCAGVLGVGRVAKNGSPTDLDRFEHVLRVNLLGTINCVRLTAGMAAALEPNEEAERAVIVNTSSIAAFDGVSGQVAYSAAKGGIAALTLPWARELGSWGIRVMTIAPGLFSTAMADGVPEQTADQMLLDASFPKRQGRPEEFAAAVVAVVENVMFNGEVVRLDAGLRLRDPQATSVSGR